MRIVTIGAHPIAASREAGVPALAALARYDPRDDPGDRERIVVRRLRIIMLGVLALAAAAIALAYLPVTIVTDFGGRPESSDDAVLLRVYLAVLFGPGIAAALRPDQRGRGPRSTGCCLRSMSAS